MADGRKLVNVDGRFPVSLTGEAGKQLTVNAEETGYEHGSVEAGAPTGSLLLYLFDSLPVGYIPTNATYNYDDYPNLGALFGATTGETFTVPEILFIKNSYGTNTRNVEPADIGTHGHIADALPNHNHSVSINAAGNHAHGGVYNYEYSGTYDTGGSKTGVDRMIGTNTGYAGAHGHSGSCANASSGTPVIQDYVGTNQPECTLINIGIKF